MKFPKSCSQLMLVVVLLVSALSSCALKQNTFSYATPDQPNDPVGYQEKTGWATQGFSVAAANPLATDAGYQVLKAGGSAIDAAIAVNAMMGLVAPMNDGIGGDLFAIVYDAKSGKLFGLNASGWAPKGLTAEFLQSKGMTRMPQKCLS